VKPSRSFTPECVHSGHTEKIAVHYGLSAMDCGFLWQGAAHRVEPVLPFGVHIVDDAAQAVCRHDIAEQDELEVCFVQQSSGSIQS
jgi:hypothetical protein